MNKIIKYDIKMQKLQNNTELLRHEKDFYAY